MLQRLDAGGVAPTTPVRAALAVEALGDPRQQDFQRSLQSLLGKTIQGQVMARLADGSFLVKVAGTPARMQLPAGAQVGAEVPLKLIALEPRATFQVGAGRAAAVSVALAYAEPGAPGKPGTPAGAQGPQPPLPGQGQSPAQQQLLAQPQTLASTQLQQQQPAPAPGQPPTQLQGQAQLQARPEGAAKAAGARAGSLAAGELGKAPLTPAALLPDFDASAPPPVLSSTARAITSILSQAESRPGAPLAILGKGALVTPGAAGPEPAVLARSLHEAVGASGLFYESHVAEWAEGKRTLQELLREPQMAQAAPGERAAAAAAGTDLASAQLINLQLHTHEQARVLWQGEVWPGQQMEWEIKDDTPEGRRDGEDEADQQRSWRSGVRFNFPLLGAVSASVLLVGGQVHIQVQAGSEASAAALRLHAGELEQSMDAAGSPLSSLTISGQDGENDHAQ